MGFGFRVLYAVLLTIHLGGLSIFQHLTSGRRLLDRVINVGLADVKTAQSPFILTTPPLGSCVVIMLYDESTRIGSMGHVLLPDIKLAKSRGNRSKFANTAVEIMLQEMVDMGAVRRRIKAKIAGGANMFHFLDNANVVHIGSRNITAVSEELKKRKIRLVAEDTVGNYARSVKFFLETGLVKIKNPLYGNKEI